MTRDTSIIAVVGLTALVVVVSVVLEIAIPGVAAVAAIGRIGSIVAPVVTGLMAYAKAGSALEATRDNKAAIHDVHKAVDGRLTQLVRAVTGEAMQTGYGIGLSTDPAVAGAGATGQRAVDDAVRRSREEREASAATDRVDLPLDPHKGGR